MPRKPRNPDITPSKALESETRARRITVGPVDCKGAATMSDAEFKVRMESTRETPEDIMSRLAQRRMIGAAQSGYAPAARDTRELTGRSW